MNLTIFLNTFREFSNGVDYIGTHCYISSRRYG